MSAPHIDQMNAGGGVPLLSVRHLRVEFPGRRGTLVAIDDVSFDIARGEGNSTRRRRTDSSGRPPPAFIWSICGTFIGAASG